MAIDTAPKRRSAATTSVAWGPVSVTPNASPDVAWRQSSGWGYEGIAAGAPVADPDPLALDGQTWAKVQPAAVLLRKNDPAAQEWAKVEPGDQTWRAL